MTNQNPRPEHPYYQSSTGMLHIQGCHQLSIMRSRVLVLSPEAAAKVTLRCQTCRPCPLGTEVDQATDRKAARLQQRQAQAAEFAARRQAQHEDHRAATTPELDEAIRAFYAADAADAPEAGDLYRAMTAMTPEGYSTVRRAREMGL